MPSPQYNTVIYLKDVEATHLQLLLTYMYRGEVNVEDCELAEFLKTAAGLQVRGLTESQTSRQTNSHSQPGGRPPGQKKVKEEVEEQPTTTWAPQLAPQTAPQLPPQSPPAPHQAKHLSPPPLKCQPVTNSGQLERFQDDIADYSSEGLYDDDHSLGGVGGAQWKTTEDGGGDRLNKAFPCEMCNMSFNQKWLLRLVELMVLANCLLIPSPLTGDTGRLTPASSHTNARCV